MRMLLQKVPRAALRPHLHRITICPVRASVLESLLGGSVVRVHEDAPVCVGVGVGVGVGGCGWVCACVSVHVLHVCMHARKRRRLLLMNSGPVLCLEFRSSNARIHGSDTNKNHKP